MRKIITTTFVTLDGVMQAPGGPEEDKTGGFEYGGWQIDFPSDEMMDSKLAGIMGMPFELLLGKTTYDIFAAYWPTAKTDLEIANPFNTTKKYVVSEELFEPSWDNSFCITGDVVTQLKKLKDTGFWVDAMKLQAMLEPRQGDEPARIMKEAVIEIKKP